MGGFFAKPLQRSKFRRFRSVILGKLGADEPSPPRSVLDPNVSSVADVMGDISKLAGVTHVRTQTRKVKVRGKVEIIGGAASCRKG